MFICMVASQWLSGLSYAWKALHQSNTSKPNTGVKLGGNGPILLYGGESRLLVKFSRLCYKWRPFKVIFPNRS